MKRLFSGFAIVFFSCQVAGAPIIGTTNNDLILFGGTDTLIDETITLPNGEVLNVSGNYNVNNNTYNGLDGFDTVLMSSFNDYLKGEDVVNVERFIAGNGDDFIDLRNMAANEDLSLSDTPIETLGGLGEDLLIGTNTQKNIIKGSNGDDVVFGGNLGDELEGNNDNDSVYGLRGEDHIDGGKGNDRLFGGEDNDILIGGVGDDFIEGGAGSDTIILGNGQDTVSGGSGNDVFAFDVGDRLIDTILDFEIGDLFNLTDMLVFSVGDDLSDFIRFDYQASGANIAINSRGTGNNSDFYTIAFLQDVTSGLSFQPMSSVIYDDPTMVLQSTQSNLLAGGIFLTSPSQVVDVSSPATISIFLLGLGLIVFRKKAK
jgi:Ca2+-binding RTX toxin-like protein